MFNIFVIAKEDKTITELRSELIQNGFACSIVSDENEAIEEIAEHSPDLVLVAMDGYSTNSGIRELCQRIKLARQLPIIALVAREALDSLGIDPSIDDFVIKPYDVRELVLRAKRLLPGTSSSDNSEQIRCGDLVIDLAKCEVSLAGEVVLLAFREYELLKFLASNGGRVFTREALLNKVWGYDYYGGDRTVDVHIRRLRSKLEDATHTFIETVRNIGYRFRGSN
ncbi:MAG: response regulator transcription factor [Chloroflexi bacterium]|nr:response regulator transcription factor [Chloroflexota bacterium]MBI3931740.1 response regulator transcription factor [Chloroflexota bacterium]